MTSPLVILFLFRFCSLLRHQRVFTTLDTSYTECQRICMFEGKPVAFPASATWRRRSQRVESRTARDKQLAHTVGLRISGVDVLCMAAS